ncbi:MAG: DUF4175 family protein [bacterium]
MKNLPVEQKLYNFSLKLKGIEFIRGVVLFLTVSLFFIIAVTPLINYFGNNYNFLSALRYGSFLFLGTVFVFLQLPLFKKYKAEKTAFLVENHIPELKDTVITYVQLKKYLKNNIYGYSLNLVSAYLENSGQIIGKYNFKKAVSLKPLRNNFILFSAASALTLFLVIISPDMFAAASSFFSNEFIHGSPYFPLKVIPGNTKIFPGNDLEITAFSLKIDSSDMKIFYWTKEDEIKNQDFNSLTKTKHQTTLARVTQDTKYYVAQGDLKSPEYSIEIAEKPEIRNFEANLVFPEYTKLPPKTIKDNWIKALTGTKTKIAIDCSKELKTANIKFISGKKIPMDARKNKAFGEITIKKDDDYYIDLRDKEGYTNESPRYKIDAVLDNPPDVKIIEPGKNITVDERMMVPLKISVNDDFGIETIELKTEIVGRNETASVSLMQKPEGKGIVFDYNWNLSGLGFLPEDTIIYYVESKDNDNISGPNIGKSETYQIHFPSLFEIYKDTEDSQLSENVKLQKVLQEQKELKEKTEKFIKSMSQGEEFDWTKEKELESIHKGEEKVKENLENILKNMKTTADRLSKSIFIKEDTLEKIAEIQKILNEVLTAEMKEMLDKINKALQQTELSEKQKSLMETQFNQKEFEEKIDRTLNLLKRTQAEQKLDALINELNQLANRQEKNIFPDNKAVREEKAIKKEVNDVKNGLDKLSRDLNEMDKNTSGKLKEAGSEMEEKALEKKIDDLVKKLEDAVKKNIKKIDEKVSPELKDMAKKLSKIKNDFKEKSMQEILSAIEKTINYGLIISSSGNEINEITKKSISEASSGASEEKRQELAGKENNLKQGVNLFEKEYKELTKKFVFINPRLTENIQSAQMDINQAVEELKNGQTPMALSYGKEGVGKVNSTTFYLIKLYEELSKAPPGGGSDSLMEELKNLSNRQENLNELTKNLENLIKKQGGLTPQEENILQQMAFEQSLIKQALEELEKQMQSLSEKIGDFGGALNDMDEVEKGLKNKETGEKLQQKQRRILTRLLDAQKSIRQREAGKQWKSTTGREFEIKERPGDLPGSLKEIKKKILSEIENIQDEKIPWEYRELVEGYFRRLSEEK